MVGTRYYHDHMAVRKLSVALDDAVAQGVARAAERAGVSVSAWLNHAAENELAIEAGLDAVREWEADHGELTSAELAAADTLLDRVLDAARRAS
jgi:predicted transcriptional regulator